MYKVLSGNDIRKIQFDEHELAFTDFPKPTEPYNKFEVEDAVNTIIRTWDANLTIYIEALMDNGEPTNVMLVFNNGS